MSKQMRWIVWHYPDTYQLNLKEPQGLQKENIAVR